MLPGFAFFLLQETGLPSFTMTAGGTSQPGYLRANYGTISTEPLPGTSLDALVTDSGNAIQMQFLGDHVAALTGYNGIEINGIRYSFSGSWTYSSGSLETQRSTATSTFTFTSGTSYTCQLVA